MGTHGVERREHPRAQVANVFAHVLAGSRSVPLQVTDLSVGGLRGRLNEPFPSASDRISLTLARPGWQQALRIDACRIEPQTHLAGGVLRLAFDPLPPDTARLISNVVAGCNESPRVVRPGPLAKLGVPFPARPVELEAWEYRRRIQELEAQLARSEKARREVEFTVAHLQRELGERS